jgi:hypothetical protein
LEKRNLFRHNFKRQTLAALDFSVNRKTQANEQTNKKAGVEAGLLQFSIESV